MTSGADQDGFRGQLDKLPEFLTRAQVARVAQVSERTVDRHIRAGRLKAQRTNGHVRIHRKAVLAWLGVALLLTLLLVLVGGYNFDAARDALLVLHSAAVS
jgi:excisionase family DNA binding protein